MSAVKRKSKRVDEGVKIEIRLHRPSLKEKFFFFTSGIIMSVPLTLFIDQLTGYLLLPLSTFYATLLSVAVFAPFIEEFAKAYPLFYRHGETERSIFNLGFLVGLGFGILEMLTYVLALGVPVLFRLPGVFFHPASTSITAYGIATKRPIIFYLAAVSLHFSNNFLALISPFNFSTSILIVAIALFISWNLQRRTAEKIVS